MHVDDETGIVSAFQSEHVAYYYISLCIHLSIPILLYLCNFGWKAIFRPFFVAFCRKRFIMVIAFGAMISLEVEMELSLLILLAAIVLAALLVPWFEVS